MPAGGGWFSEMARSTPPLTGLGERAGDPIRRPSPINPSCCDGVEPMLMSNKTRPARLHYMAGTFRMLSPGDHVVCAVTGKPIPLDKLRYWSIDRQEASAAAAASKDRKSVG